MQAYHYLLLYLAAVNLFGGALFAWDKRLATEGKRRIPEARLHLYEFLGASFLVVPLMYLIRHKNRKLSYYWLSWLALGVWLAGLYLAYPYLGL